MPSRLELFKAQRAQGDMMKDFNEPLTKAGENKAVE
jgi:hypothetical protein